MTWECYQFPLPRVSLPGFSLSLVCFSTLSHPVPALSEVHEAKIVLEYGRVPDLCDPYACPAAAACQSWHGARRTLLAFRAAAFARFTYVLQVARRSVAACRGAPPLPLSS